MRAAYRWLVDDWEWPYAATLAAVVLLPLFPVLWSSGGLWLALVFLQLPVYMLHQLEEHAGDRFRRFVNEALGGGAEVLTRGAVFWINSLLVWALFITALLLAEFVDPALGLIAVFVTGLNALIHLAATLARREYNPGLYTAVGLMLPVAIGGTIAIADTSDAGAGYVIGAAAVAVGTHAALVGFALRRARAVDAG